MNPKNSKSIITNIKGKHLPNHNALPLFYVFIAFICPSDVNEYQFTLQSTGKLTFDQTDSEKATGVCHLWCWWHEVTFFRFSRIKSIANLVFVIVNLLTFLTLKCINEFNLFLPSISLTRCLMVTITLIVFWVINGEMNLRKYCWLFHCSDPGKGMKEKVTRNAENFPQMLTSPARDQMVHLNLNQKG